MGAEITAAGCRRALPKRLAETALKLAALLALEEDSGTILSIRETHFHIASKITDKWAGNALRLVAALGRSSFQRDCEQVLRTIKQYPDGIQKGTQLLQNNPKLFMEAAILLGDARGLRLLDAIRSTM